MQQTFYFYNSNLFMKNIIKTDSFMFNSKYVHFSVFIESKYLNLEKIKLKRSAEQ